MHCIIPFITFVKNADEFILIEGQGGVERGITT